MNVWGYGFFGFAILLINILYPTLSHRTVRFGVVVPSGKTHDDKLRSIVNWYRSVSGCIGGLFVVIGIILVNFEVITPLTAFVYLVPLSQISNFIIYIITYGKVNRLKKEQGWQVNKQRHIVVDLSTQNRAVLSRWFYLFPLLFIAINVITIAYYYDQIPDQFPIHYTSGVVDRITEKSIHIVFLPNVIQLFFLAIMIGVMEGIIRSKKQVYLPLSNDPTKRSFQRRHLLVAHAIIGIGLILFSVVQLAIVRFFSSNIGWIVEAANVLILAIAFIFGRSKKQISNNEVESESNLSEPRIGWKWGTFYINRHDPAIIVERLDGTGFTVNFGRIGGWAVIVAPIFFAAIIIWYSFQ